MIDSKICHVSKSRRLIIVVVCTWRNLERKTLFYELLWVNRWGSMDDEFIAWGLGVLSPSPFKCTSHKCTPWDFTIWKVKVWLMISRDWFEKVMSSRYSKKNLWNLPRSSVLVCLDKIKFKIFFAFVVLDYMAWLNRLGTSNFYFIYHFFLFP